MVANETSGEASPGRQKPWRRAARRGVALALGLAALAAFGSGSAMAQRYSGETEEATLGTHLARNACSKLGASGDIYFVCNAGLDSDREPCNVTSLNELVVRGAALGFCADPFENREIRVIAPTADVLEADKTVGGAVFGSNMGIQRGSSSRDVVCTTFSGEGTGATASPGERVCVEVFEGSGGAPAFCGKLKVSNNPIACDALDSELRRTVTGKQVPDFTHALFFNALDNVGGDDSQTLFVCGTGYSWDCMDASDATAIDYDVDFSIEGTPGCYTRKTRTGYQTTCY
jgi:hypothetical protein